MLDNADQAEAAAKLSSDVLLDLGDFVTAGRRPPRWLRIIAWLITFGGAGALWRSFHWLFETFPDGRCWPLGFGDCGLS
jgi:hypothetical protein